MDYYRERGCGTTCGALALLFDLVAACASPGPVAAEGSADRRLVGEATCLVESLLETGMNVDELAKRLHVTRQKLLEAFRNERGETPTAYLQAMRLARTKRLLENTDLKVSAVSRACGYRNEKYFYRRFRELTGCSPSVWRARGRRDAAP
jgi:transcriptional regulator GlxA family with amidase domain